MFVKFALLFLFLLGMLVLSGSFLPTAIATSSSSSNIQGKGMMKSMLSLIHGQISLPLSIEEQRNLYADIILACHQGLTVLSSSTAPSKHIILSHM